MAKRKLIILSLILIVVTCISYMFFRFHTSDFIDDESCFITEPYGDSEKYFYISEDYIAEGCTALEQGCYERVELEYGGKTILSIYIPVDENTLERLPSSRYTDGTTIEIDGKTYEIHVNDNEYRITRMEEN